MTDRELLELAAKAAGMIPPPDGMTVGEGGPMSKGGLVFTGNGTCIDWNPLTDDGDALRLAVKLRITPHIDGNLTEAESTYGFCTEPHFDDPCAAARRAITRAAAEIGKAAD